ncbi:uncharacterized protein LOC133329286 [Musca vetustissima]|uniref:uncharacterized protein LOC133329286 n=1 Tax=Musca vetustissima TaxID=27455 RepID=UPI002AB7D6BC|nr:uncharacterized protein LOC133329286 [Musca vetustissima]
MTTVFQGRLSENLKFGHILEIVGEAEENGYWFSISLASDKFNECDDAVHIGLRMSVYLQEDLIVFKQRLHGEWKTLGSEEFLGRIFLKQFQINMALDEKKIYISINDRKLTFLRFVPLPKDLNTISITGDVKSLKKIDHRSYFPSLWPPINLTENHLEFSNDLPNSYQPGQVMVVTMSIFGKPNGRFHMHFCNIYNWKRQEVHISVRFDSRKIVRTSKLPVQDYMDTSEENFEKLIFGIEEIHGDFPFDRFPVTCKFAFGFTAEKILVAKDGRFLFDFNFRTLNVLSELSGLKILCLQGMSVHVKAIDHLQMEDPQCLTLLPTTSILRTYITQTRNRMYIESITHKLHFGGHNIIGELVTLVTIGGETFSFYPEIIESERVNTLQPKSAPNK